MAEKLFASCGFHATSVSEIASAAGVNKALIYYHFKNKDDLILHLFESIMAEVLDHVEQATGTHGSDASVREEIQKEIEFLSGRRRIVSVMLAEAFRSTERDDFLFRCAEIAIQKEHAAPTRRADERMARAQMVREFFTGFLPLVAFVALRDKWCKHYGCSPDEVTRDFIEAFAASHLETHPPRGA